MQAFTTSHNDPLTAAAAAILFKEDLTTVKDKVKGLKVGDVTNFGTVKNISDTSIEFKARDTGVTKISLNQRKMGSKDFVLDKLVKITKEETELEEGKYQTSPADTYGLEMDNLTLDKKVIAKLDTKAISDLIKYYDTPQLKTMLSAYGRGQTYNAYIKAFKTRGVELGIVKEEAELDEAKAADPANLRSIIANHTALLGKATEPEAKTFHKTAIANAKEKLKSLGEEVELDEENKTYRIFARFNNKNAKGVWQKINWSTEASSKEEAEAKFRKRMGKDIIKDLEITEGSCEDDEDTIEEGINFAAVAAAKKAGMSDAAIDSYVKIHKANGATDKEINAALLSGKAMKKEGACEDDEDEGTIEEEYKPRSPKVIKILDQIDGFSGGEWLDFWKGFQQYAQTLADGDMEDDKDSWGVIANLLTKAVKEYQLHINY